MRINDILISDNRKFVIKLQKLSLFEMIDEFNAHLSHQFTKDETEIIRNQILQGEVYSNYLYIIKLDKLTAFQKKRLLKCILSNLSYRIIFKNDIREMDYMVYSSILHAVIGSQETRCYSRTLRDIDYELKMILLKQTKDIELFPSLTEIKSTLSYEINTKIDISSVLKIVNELLKEGETLYKNYITQKQSVDSKVIFKNNVSIFKNYLKPLNIFYRKGNYSVDPIYYIDKIGNEIICKEGAKLEFISYSINSLFDFGIFVGLTISEVLDLDPNYILWSIINKSEFVIDMPIMYDKRLRYDPLFFEALVFNDLKNKVI